MYAGMRLDDYMMGVDRFLGSPIGDHQYELTGVVGDTGNRG